MKLLALALALAGCAGAGPFVADAVKTPAERCDEAEAAYDALPERTVMEAALVVVACM